MTSVVESADRYSVWVVGKDVVMLIKYDRCEIDENNAVMECPQERVNNGLEDVPLSAMTDKMMMLSRESYGLAGRINAHLFGATVDPIHDLKFEPNCYREVLDLHIRTLDNLLRELEMIAKGIGI